MAIQRLLLSRENLARQMRQSAVKIAWAQEKPRACQTLCSADFAHKVSILKRAGRLLTQLFASKRLTVCKFAERATFRGRQAYYRPAYQHRSNATRQAGP